MGEELETKKLQCLQLKKDIDEKVSGLNIILFFKWIVKDYHGQKI